MVVRRDVMEAAWHDKLAMGRNIGLTLQSECKVCRQVSLASPLSGRALGKPAGQASPKERLHGGAQVDQDESGLLPCKVSAARKGIPF